MKRDPTRANVLPLQTNRGLWVVVGSSFPPSADAHVCMYVCCVSDLSGVAYYYASLLMYTYKHALVHSNTLKHTCDLLGTCVQSRCTL